MARRRLMIVALGDSTTAGTPGFRSPLEAPPDGRGNPESQYAFWMMRRHPEWTVLNRGVDGERSDQIRGRFARDVLAVRPDYVIILAGVNDIFQGLPPEEVERNLGPMYAEAIDARVVPVAASVLPYDVATHRDDEAMHELNHWIESLARILSMPFCDTRAAVALAGSPDRLGGTPDGLHPDVNGYRRMGDALVGTIELHLAGNPPRRA